MTATHGEGTYGNAAGTVTPLDHKMSQLGHVVKTAANTIRAGLFWDGSATIVSGKANMSYDVRALTCVLSRGATAGAVFLSNDAVYNVVTTAAPGSNSRYDVVYIWQREYSLDGTDSNPVIGVVQGTAAASPTVPSLAAFPGALELARILVPSGVTATNSGTTITQTGVFTATAGGVVPVRSTTERDAGTWVESQVIWLIDTDTLQVYSGSAWGPVATTPGLLPIIPTSVAAGSGTATIGTTGKITFTTVGTNLSVNGCFTSTYTNYRFILRVLTKSAAGNLNTRLRAAGTDSSAASYDQIRGIDVTSARTVGSQAAGTSWQSMHGANYAVTIITGDILGPQTTSITALIAEVVGYDGAGVVERDTFTAFFRATTSFDGITFIPSTGTWTGDLVIEGYNI